MERNHWTRSAFSGVLGILAVLLVSYTFPPLNNQPRGLVLPEKVVRAPAQAETVKTLPDAPLTAEPMGVVHLLLHIENDPTPADEALILNKARELAASVGANALVIRYDGPVQSGPFHALLFQADALYVPKGGV